MPAWSDGLYKYRDPKTTKPGHAPGFSFEPADATALKQSQDSPDLFNEANA